MFPARCSSEGVGDNRMTLLKIGTTGTFSDGKRAIKLVIKIEAF